MTKKDENQILEEQTAEQAKGGINWRGILKILVSYVVLGVIVTILFYHVFRDCPKNCVNLQSGVK